MKKTIVGRYPVKGMLNVLEIHAIVENEVRR